MNKFLYNEGSSKQENVLFRIYNNQEYTKQLDKLFQPSSKLRNKGSPKRKYENNKSSIKGSNLDLLDKIVSETFHLYHAYTGDFLNKSTYSSEKKKRYDDLDLSAFMKQKPGGFFRDHTPKLTKVTESSVEKNNTKLNHTMVNFSHNDSIIESNEIENMGEDKSISKKQTNQFHRYHKLISKKDKGIEPRLKMSNQNIHDTSKKNQSNQNYQKNQDQLDVVSQRLKHTYRLDKEKILSRINPFVKAIRKHNKLPSLGNEQPFRTLDTKNNSRNQSPDKLNQNSYLGQQRSKSVAIENLPMISPNNNKSDFGLEIIPENNRIQERKLKAEELRTKDQVKMEQNALDNNIKGTNG